MRRASILFVFAVAIAVSPWLEATQITEATLEAFERWTGAVQRHVPGRADDELAVASELTFEQRVLLDEGMSFFLSALRKRSPRATTDATRRLLSLAKAAAGDNPNLFLKRAAVLHADAAMIRAPRALDVTELAPEERGGTGSPIFPKGVLVLDDDGESRGHKMRDWHWVFARSLLDLLSPRDAHLPFIAAWYHATTAQMFRDGAYGEATFQLEHAYPILPDNAAVLYDIACLSEVDGLPIFQQTLSDEELEGMRRRLAPSTGKMITNGRGFVTIAALAAVPPVEVANADAERYFRRALQIDPSLTEAHVRLARLLTVRGRHAEALTEAGAALAAKPDPVVEFLAHMFAARATRALGRLEDAADHYAKARALFPGAQSAAIGASQVALLRADVSGATTAIRQLGGRGSKPDLESDPWWGYRLASGRTSNALLDAMWKMVAQGE